jgi:hypothetical protein
MRAANKASVAASFNKRDFHDDALLSVGVHPSRTRSNLTRIDFQFRDDSTGDRKLLSFHGCANFRFLMDFDVLADRWYFGTSGSVARSDDRRMKKFVTAQKSHWRTMYMPPTPKDMPIQEKLKSIRSYVLFRLAFFGGTAEILAKNYSLRG